MPVPGEVFTGRDSSGRSRQYVADHTGAVFQYAKPRGTRTSLTLPPGFEQRLVNAPKVGRELAAIVAGIASLADQTCPVGETGDLKASQVSEVRITPQGPVGLVAYLAFYAHFVHNGTIRQAADPWLLNAALAVMAQARSSGAVAAA